MQKPVLPEEIDIDGNAIIIRWEDGHRSPYPHRYLRLRCPCAGCVDEMTGRPTLDPDTVPQDVRAEDQIPVGNYAVQFLWSDAHYTGLYTYQMLRAACTCIACNAARGESPPAGS